MGKKIDIYIPVGAVFAIKIISENYVSSTSEKTTNKFTKKNTS